MSSSNRATSKGGKSTKADTTKTQKSDKTDTQKLEKNKSGKGSGDKSQSQQNSDSIRNAKYKDLRTEDPSMKEKVCAVIELTQRSEEDVCFALHECGFDSNLAVNMLLESTDQEWVTSVKKKKNRQAVPNKTDSSTEPGDEWQDSAPAVVPEKSRGPPRMRGRGWRGRENRENEKNLEGGDLGRRGGRLSGRGGRGGGRLGSRTFQSRDGFKPRPTMDTWNNPAQPNPTNSSNEPENWDNDFPSPIDDWYNEEYTGSLTETKVFTPSTAMEEAAAAAAAAAAADKIPEVSPQSWDVASVSAAPAEAEVSPAPPSATLTAAQSQYLTQLTQQNVDAKPLVQSPPPQTSPTYSSRIQEPQPQTLPTRTKTQRARVPPPSKIPATAVEMPGDLNVGYLDVQFGAMDFMDNSFDGVSDKFSSSANSSLEPPAPTAVANLDLTAQAPPMTLSSAVLTPDNDLSYAQSRAAPSGAVPPVTASLDITKVQEVGYSQPQSNSYQSYQKTNSSVYPSQNYNSNNYQTSSQVASTTTYGGSQPSNNYVNSNSYSGANNYQNNSYSSNAGYQSTAAAASAAGYPNISQAATYPASATVSQSSYQHQPTQSVQSVYGASSGLSNSTNYNATNSSQYNSYNAGTSSHNHKIAAGKDQVYDSTTTSSSNSAPVTTASVSASPALGLTNSQTSSVSAGTKNTTSSTAKSGVVANIPPGVAPMMGTQYIMGQAGMPYFQQPMYSYEDLQLLQQRVPPHIGAAYYDIGYQTPTTLAAREGSIASGAYSMSDSRFTRDNASPVPSTLSQQTSTQSHQAQPMLSATLPPGYAYFYNAGGMMPGSFSYGTPAIYPQMPAATNAHGSTNLSQYPKPSNYGSGYGSGYDALSQTQDYAKSGYVSGTQTQSKAGGVGANAVTTGSSVATDLSVMYGKSHAALGKVNSYEKQGFHSGTPPPFNLAGNQSAGIAPSGTYGPQMYIPTMPQQHHHSTTLMHQPLHQMDMRHQARRMDSGNSTGQRSQSSSQAKSGAKQTYPNSYWNPA